MEIPSIRYRKVECKSLLNKSGISDYAVNCYSGCGHGCIYCYARFATRFTHPGEDWGTFVDIKENAPQVLMREVKRKPVGHVMLSSVCDAWQPVEKSCQLTRRCLEILLRYRYPVSVLTKSTLARRDLDIMTSGEVDFGVTVTTPDASLARLIEPGASPPEERLNLLQEAKDRGISTYAFIGPLLPFISDSEENITALLKAVKEIGVDSFLVDKLNLRYGVWPALTTFLRKHYPDLLAQYRKIYFDPALKATYLENFTAKVNAVAVKLGIADKMTLCI
jgi:DNA repair photolyase